MKDRDFPPVPSVAFSHLGPVEITRSELGDLLGLTQFFPRTIKLAPGVHPAVAWSTYWHEVVHLALFDAGVKIPRKAEESVCDAIGTYLAAAVRSGFVKVCESAPRK